MVIRMLEYNKDTGSYMPAGEIDSSEWPLHDAIARFLRDSNVDICIYLRSTFIPEVEKHLKELGISMTVDEFISKYKHTLSKADFMDFDYVVEKGREMLFMAGDPFKMSINDANVLLKFAYGSTNNKLGKEKQQYVLTYMDRVQ